MAQDTPARKRIAFLIITIALIGLSSGSVHAATKKVVAKTVAVKKVTTVAKKKSVVVKKTTSTSKTKSQVKGEKVTANKVSVVGDNTISTYKVKNGDTLSSIAKKFDISINTIRWSNNINSKDSIHVGQVLTILPTTGVIYVVKKGDTLSGIAVKFHADQDDILNANDLDDADSVKIGMKLAIPNVEPLDAATSVTAEHDVTTPAENIAPVTQAPTVQSPSVTPPTTSTQTPGVTMIVTNPVTTNSYAITVTPPSASSIAIPLSDIRGYYAQPVSGRLSQGIHDVNAVDIATPVGTAVHAAAEGTIIVAMGNGRYNGGYGNYIVVSHQNGTQTLYAHLSKVTVALGEMVTQGEQIALSGNTGNTTGAHLHFEVRGAANPWGVDPVGTHYNI